MRVYKYINGRCYVADAPDDAHPIYLGPQAEIDLVITAINWAKAYARVQDPKTKREVVVPFPDKWYQQESLRWFRHPDSDLVQHGTP